MSAPLEPNDEGTVCCVCRRPIVPNVDCIHGAYWGKEARHYECTASAKFEKSKAGVQDAIDRAYQALDKLRQAIRE